MRPVSPVIPGYEPFEINVGEGQKQYFPIPTIVEDTKERRFFSRWEFTDDERQLIAEGGSLIFQQLTFGEKFQPIAFQVVAKIEISQNEQVHIPDATGEPYDVVEKFADSQIEAR